MDYILFIVGFFILLLGAHLLVDNASALAKILGISPLIVGLTVVAFGTSLPELIVNLFANNEGNSDLAISNILGTNIANILLLIGIAAFIYPLKVHARVVWREILFVVFASVMLAALLADKLLADGTTSGFVGLSRVDGFVLLSYFVVFLYYSFGSARVSSKQAKKEQAEIKTASLATVFIKITIGIAGLYIGGRWLVSGASEIASLFGVSDSLIGLTIVAIGTSGPELFASIIAAMKKNVDIAIGTAVGSNLFNIFFVLGTSAVIRPLSFNPDLRIDLGIMVGSAFLLFGAMLFGRVKHQIGKMEGVLFIALYTIYIVFVVLRG